MSTKIQLDKKQKIIVLVVMIAFLFLIWQIFSLVQADVNLDVNKKLQTEDSLVSKILKKDFTFNKFRKPNSELSSSSLNEVANTDQQLINQYEIAKIQHHLEEQLIETANAKQFVANSDKKIQLNEPAMVNETIDNKSVDQLSYLDQKNGQWTATIIHHGQFLSIKTGAVLDDGTKIEKVDQHGVQIFYNNRRQLLTFQGIQFVNASAIDKDAENLANNNLQNNAQELPKITEKPPTNEISPATVKSEESIINKNIPNNIVINKEASKLNEKPISNEVSPIVAKNEETVVNNAEVNKELPKITEKPATNEVSPATVKSEESVINKNIPNNIVINKEASKLNEKPIPNEVSPIVAKNEETVVNNAEVNKELPKITEKPATNEISLSLSKSEGPVIASQKILSDTKKIEEVKAPAVTILTGPDLLNKSHEGTRFTPIVIKDNTVSNQLAGLSVKEDSLPKNENSKKAIASKSKNSKERSKKSASIQMQSVSKLIMNSQKQVGHFVAEKMNQCTQVTKHWFALTNNSIAQTKSTLLSYAKQINKKHNTISIAQSNKEFNSAKTEASVQTSFNNKKNQEIQSISKENASENKPMVRRSSNETAKAGATNQSNVKNNVNDMDDVDEVDDE